MRDRRVVLGVAASSVLAALLGGPSVATAAEPERTILGSYFLSYRPYTDSQDNERYHFDAVVSVPDVEGAVYYLLEARGGYDPYFYGDNIDKQGPAFDGDDLTDRPEGEHWWFLSGGDGPASGTAARRAEFDSRFASGWEWKVRVGFAAIAARLEAARRWVEEGQTFEVTVRVNNPGEQPVDNVAPTLTVVSDGDGAADLASGPDPASGVSLSGRQEVAFKYTYKATKSGLLTLSADVVARDLEGTELSVPASVDCPSASGPGCTATTLVVEVTSADFDLGLAQFRYTFSAGSEPDIPVSVSNTSESAEITDVEISLAAFPVDAGGNATGTLLSSDPDPPHFATLQPSAGSESVTFTVGVGLVDTQIPEGGLLAVEISAVGKDANGNVIRASKDCGASADQPLAAGDPGCDPATGRILLKISSGCAVSIFDETRPLPVSRPKVELHTREDGKVIACGGGGSLCKVINDPKDYLDQLELVEESAAGILKNVGQEVVLRADIALPPGKTQDDILKVDWSIGGTTIESYQDFSAFQRGLAGGLLFAARGEANNRTLFKTRKVGDETREDWERAWFFWKNTGAHEVKAEVTIDDGEAEDIVCSKQQWFDVERNSFDPKRQPEKFYTTCCSKALDPGLEGLKTSEGTAVDGSSRVSSMHSLLHTEDDAQPIFPGDSWINFHRVIVNSFDAWRAYFGYPPVAMWNGAIPIPETENGYDTTEPSRFTSAPQCGQFFATQDALCPLPPWFTREGAVDGGGTPIVRPQEPIADNTICKDAAGTPVGAGQAVIDDFATNPILGCFLAKTWHANLHFLISGLMAGTATSPQDPVFWRMHNFLSGAEIGGTPGFLRGGDRAARDEVELTDLVPVYLGWELAKAVTAPPAMSVGLPQAGRHVSAIPVIVVQFWEHVTGVTADDVTVNGSPATGVEVVHINFGQGNGRDYYLFSGFAAPALGEATVAVLPGAITDDQAEPFAGTSWTVTVETDTDGDGIAQSVDNCPDEPNPTQANSDHLMLFSSQYESAHGHHGDALGDACDDDDDDDGISDADEETRGSNPRDANDPDGCPDDQAKREGGLCGCGTADVDSDGDTIVDCSDGCPQDPDHIEAPCAAGCDADECLDVDQSCKRCGQPVGSGASPTASDALAVLRAAVGTSQCATCVCDVDASGNIVASDALLTLKRAVGQSVTLDCHGHQH